MEKRTNHRRSSLNEPNRNASIMSTATRLSKTVALVTGGGSGLGAAAANYLLKNGARVLVGDLDKSRWEATVLQLQPKQSADRCLFAHVDVTQPDSISKALDRIQQEFGEPLNAAINCAGVATARKMISKNGTIHTDAEFIKTLTVNTIGSFQVARLAAERMKDRAPDDDDEKNGLRGCIIQTASIAAYEGQMGQVAYAASKGAVVGMTLPMARDLACFGIRVMTIAPGLFATPLLDGLPEPVKEELGSTVPCPNRLGNPEEFGQLVASILENPMLNGSVIRLDGALRLPP